MILTALVPLAAIALLIAGPVIYRERRKKKRQLHLAKTYERLVMHNKLSIEETLVFNNRVIGFDRRNKKLLLIDHNQASRQEECVALEQLESCELVQVKDKTKRNTTRFFLELNYKRDKGTLKFIFFDEAKDKVTEKPSLIKRAEYWKRKINLYKNRDNTFHTFEYVI